MLGICGGGGYSVKATVMDKRIKALVTITGVNFGRLMREGFSNFDPVGALQHMAAQRTAENAGADEEINLFVPGQHGRRQGRWHHRYRRAGGHRLLPQPGAERGRWHADAGVSCRFGDDPMRSPSPKPC